MKSPSVSLLAVASVTLLSTFVSGFHHDVDWIKQHLASKAPYPVTGTNRLDNITKDGYQVDQLQLVVRHGSRYPSDGDTEDIADALALLKSSTNKDALSWLHDYENIYTDERSGRLDENGQLEEYLHGRRVAKSYPALLQSIFDQGTVKRISAYATDSPRVSQSAQAFLLGLLEGHGPLGSSKQITVPMFTLPDDNNTVISFYERCPAYDKEVDDNDKTNEQSKLYEEMAESPIAERLSKELHINVTAKDVTKIYTGCSFEVSHRNNVDTFCSLLSRNDILVNEYREDLSYFYKDAYAYEINKHMACDLMKDVMANINAAISGTEDYDKISLKFGHTQSILFSETFLGLFDDHKLLLANMTQSEINNRAFRTSKIATFASNVAFQVLTKKSADQKFVRVLVSEEPVVIPGCKDIVCPIETFRKIMEPRLQCDFNKLCALE
ncbi:hypothetical protein VTP01DRAFT_1920 [Rhizomucor pusillus]|uniref:uncharacterized protein n=1 Tax=Rhizomucor pusillus TaxID=4840 RepID=UPI0037438480